MNPTHSLPTAIWAVDPRDIEQLPSHSSLEALRNYKVIPVAILKEDGEAGYTELKDFLKLCKGMGLEPGVILKADNAKSKWVDQIHTYAVEHHAELIALTSHGRSGLSRLFLGSFAERLLDISYVPILFLSKNEFGKAEAERAIFATDFTIQSKIAFQTFLKFAKHSVKEVVIFHANPLPLQTMAAAEFAGLPDMGADHQEPDGWDKSNLHLWRDELSLPDLGIHLHGIINGNCTSIARGILDSCAKEKIGIIGITAEKSLLEKSLFGSVAETLFRNQTGLVWVSNSRIQEIR
jgi:hypothetical protein